MFYNIGKDLFYLSFYLKFIYSWLLTEEKEKKYLVYLKTMLIYINFHKKHI